MYKPPENTNRVKSIKSKFENIEKLSGNQETDVKNGNRDNLSVSKNCFRSVETSCPLNLQRQLSDPAKRNIKRTPAFRLDKNTEKVSAFQRGSALNRSQEFKHILKPLNAPKMNNCDIISNTSDNVSRNDKVPFLSKDNKPILYKSKSSIDFNLIRNKFNCESNKTYPNQRNGECQEKNVSALYTEPIPKSLRVKNCDTLVFEKPVYCNLDNLSEEIRQYNGIENDKMHVSSTLKLTDKERNNKNCVISTHNKSHGGIPNGKLNTIPPNRKNGNETTNSALEKLDTLLALTKTNSLKKAKTLVKRSENSSLELTDTLKNALKRPLPSGPAPRKPPRTFAHCFKNEGVEDAENVEKNISFLHVSKNKDTEVKKPLCLRENLTSKRSDPKYMLNKLETALRNNKLKSKKAIKSEVSTSGEDSDDNVFFKNSPDSSMSNNRSLPLVPDAVSLKSNNSSPTSNSLLVQALNFNCMNGYTCVSSPYTKLNESKSSFFVNMKKEEPVYAEPWHFEEIVQTRNGSRARSVSSDRNAKNKRNSLYYLSSPVLCSSPRSDSSGSMNFSTKQKDVPSTNQNCRSEKCPSPEISSLSSFTSESAVSMEDVEKAVDIKHLINVFENKRDENEINTVNTNGHTDEIPDDRIDDLRNTLQRTIEDTFDTNDGKDSNSESERTPSERKMSLEDPTVHKFRTYVRNVSVYSKAPTRRKKSTLFECCLIVEWNADVRRIKFKFPNDVEVPNKIEDLCFPDAACGPLDKTTNAQCYSLVITNEKGERTFGYCRRVVPEGSNKCLPIAYCILSKYKSPRFYKKILIELESRHGISEYHRNKLLKSFYYNKFPQPGETVTIKVADSFGCGRNKENYTNISEDYEGVDNDLVEIAKESNFVIVNDIGEFVHFTKRKEEISNNLINQVRNYDGVCDNSGDIVLNLHHDPIYEISDLKDLHDLPVDILQKIFASLLLERKVILISCLLSKLSSCVEALQAIIYPFTWPHSFIPVLPQSLWEFVEAPTPIICGILSVEVINKHEIDDGIVVDLDEKCILKEEGDEDKVFCNSMMRVWRKSLAAAKNIPADRDAHSFHLTDSYIQMFAGVLKNYRDCIVNGNFQKELFIRSGRSKGVRRFLKWFTDTTMFQTFVDAVITESQDFSLFDQRIKTYESETFSSALDKLLDWKKIKLN